MSDLSLRHFARYTEILSVLVRHGLGYFVLDPVTLSKMMISGKQPNNFQPNYVQQNLSFIGGHLREAFTELGPTFIKVAQLASTRSDILPLPIVKELAKLQDRVRPLSFSDVRRVIEESLQQRLELVFREFDSRSLATASIGQVHQAVLNNGEKVVVKVRRPHIHEVVKTDLEIFRTLVAQLEQRTEWGKRFLLRMLLEEFSKTLWAELDFLNEGRNAEKLAQFSKKNSEIIIPKIYWEYSRSSILTMQYISGIPLSQIIDFQQGLSDGDNLMSAGKFPIDNVQYDLSSIADRLSHELLRQILLDGCFHGDPHPGNVLILSSGQIAFIDFGITGMLSISRRNQLVSLVRAFVHGKDELILKTISQMGIVPQTINRLSFQEDLTKLRAKHMNPSSKRINLGETIQDFFNLVFSYGIVIPSELVLMGKSLLTLEGVLNTLDPKLSLVEQARPFSRRLLWERYRPKNLLGGIWRVPTFPKGKVPEYNRTTKGTFD